VLHPISAICKDVTQQARRSHKSASYWKPQATNAGPIAFWQRHGYRIEATLQRYCLGRLDAYEMRKKLSSGATGNPAQKDT